MIAILKKEISTFFSTPIGYLVIGLVLIINGLLLWVFKGDYNVLDNGFADLSAFFSLMPWMLLFLVPAITMRSFSEERKQGTLELLLTKPISHLNLVLGKYLGVLLLIIIALIPTLLYVYTVQQLGNPIGNLDMGSTIGSFIGLLFLASAYSAIGVFASSLFDNQIVAFLTAVVLCLLFFIGFEGITDLLAVSTIENFGMDAHYKSISRGVIDTRDLVYFISLSLIFILLTAWRISGNKNHRMSISKLALSLGGIVALVVISSFIFKRFDLTVDKRYTMSEVSKTILNDVEVPIIIDVFLEGEGFPSEFKRLQRETRQILEEFNGINSQIKYGFINPIADDAFRERNIQQLTERGLNPMQLSVQENGRTSQEVIFPWALASYEGVTVKIPLVKNKIGVSQQELVTNSVQNLEYAFSDGFYKLLYPKRRKIAVLKGNGQLENRYIADIIKTLRDSYFIAPFTLDSVASNAQRSLEELKAFDMIISAKPTEAFSEPEKLVLDQYTMSGGKSLWLIDAVAMETDSLFNESGTGIATARDLNLTDFFFKYGARINPVLVNDLYSAPITLASGEGSQAQYNQLPWFYSPLINTSENNHPIVNNLNLVRLNFANQIDTLKVDVDKTVLLSSSILSKVDGMPRQIMLDMATKDPDPGQYTKGSQIMAVLLEGEFTSVYNNRIKPFELSNALNKSELTKMIIVADGDVIKNEVGRNGPLELGFDRWSGQLYGNKEFLMNAVNYLLDDDGLIDLRSKELSMAFLNPQKVGEERLKWQLINVVAPIVLLLAFGLSYNYFRRKKYTS